MNPAPPASQPSSSSAANYSSRDDIRQLTSFLQQTQPQLGIPVTRSSDTEEARMLNHLVQVFTTGAHKDTHANEVVALATSSWKTPDEKRHMAIIMTKNPSTVGSPGLKNISLRATGVNRQTVTQ